MSKALQWVLGISVALVALAILVFVFAAVFGWATWSRTMGPGMTGSNGMMGGTGGYGMMGGSGGYGMMGGSGGYGMMGGNGGFGMMGGYHGTPSAAGGERLSLDQAVSLATDYASAFPGKLAVTEVMEFEDNFYAVLEETSTGHGALEILIDPYTGAVWPEFGPNMMWNDKYGHMGYGLETENSLSMTEARELAQQALEGQLPGARVHDDGAEFYGYYTFDYDAPAGTIAGMLSVHGDTGAVWVHTWHGDFIAETEMGEGAS